MCRQSGAFPFDFTACAPRYPVILSVYLGHPVIPSPVQSMDFTADLPILW